MFTYHMFEHIGLPAVQDRKSLGHRPCPRYWRKVLAHLARFTLVLINQGNGEWGFYKKSLVPESVLEVPWADKSRPRHTHTHTLAQNSISNC